MKKCAGCDELKPFSDFRKNVTKSGGNQTRCKVCVAKVDKKWYDKNKEIRFRTNKLWQEKQKQKFIAFKATQKCAKCDENDIRCLDFHHVNKETKVRNVSNMMKFSFEKIMEEVSKCIVLCANCHRKEHK